MIIRIEVLCQGNIWRISETENYSLEWTKIRKNQSQRKIRVNKHRIERAVSHWVSLSVHLSVYLYMYIHQSDSQSVNQPVCLCMPVWLTESLSDLLTDWLTDRQTDRQTNRQTVINNPFLYLQAGFVSALPYLVMAITIQAGGHIADCLRRKEVLSTTVVRKLFNSFGKSGFNETEFSQKHNSFILLWKNISDIHKCSRNEGMFTKGFHAHFQASFNIQQVKIYFSNRHS